MYFKLNDNEKKRFQNPSLCVIPAGLFAATVLDEVAGDEGGDVALDALGWDAGGVGYLWDVVAGVGGEAGEDNALGCIYSLNWADDAFVKADNQMARIVLEELFVYSLRKSGGILMSRRVCLSRRKRGNGRNIAVYGFCFGTQIARMTRIVARGTRYLLSR